MHQLTLSTTEKADLEQRHKKSRDVKERDRIKVVLLTSEGWKEAQIAQALRLHRTVIRQHLKDYQARKKLTIESGGGHHYYLSAAQTAGLVAHIESNLYQHNHQIVSYIATHYGAVFTVSGLHKWLHRQGFRYKQPKGLPYKADKALQRDFVSQYETLKSELKEDDSLVFIDAVHPTQATKLSHGWIKQGQDKTLATNGSRTRLNILGGITLGRLDKAVVQRYERINAETIVDYFGLLREQHPATGTLHVILDGAGYHKAHIVKDKAKELNIELHYLPPYSPNLNPIERLWKVMNEHVRNNQFFHSAMEFRQKMDDFFQHTLPEIGSQLDSRINDNFQLLGD